ncbi:hypothetical protein DBR43_05350 [Pedobacter sp. KBW06]|uniref:hypothetical protein n=1 Tax=Pedobacter sp. KBW06 TaxID=2153359 RepID=UPI000F5B6E32|nr:hypothetical protein [Pedobacter sp. KBW06]RQO74809.1 hypothetical protein DBR43_05350 [Pedobacter sp. KBW06]
MLNKIATVLLCITSISLSAQEKITAADLARFNHYFEIKNDKLTGEGAQLLLSRMAESQFTMLGEQHAIAEISQLTNALLPHLSMQGYKNFVVEAGPKSVERMTTEIKEKGQLYDFNSKYFKETWGVPFVFFDGKEDETFLKTAIKNNFKLWGIDQEFLYSYSFLFDQMYELSKNKAQISPFYKTAKSFLLGEFKKSAASDDYKMFDRLLNNQEIKAFFEKAGSGNAAIKTIIASIIKSWEIYALYDNGKYAMSNSGRIAYMKSNFGKNYREMESKNKMPKVFFKMGAVHLSLGINSLGLYDMGNMIKELSNLNDTKALSIICAPRFQYEKDGTITDNINEEEPELIPVYQNAAKERWTLVDNKSIENYYKGRKVKLSEALKNQISKYDFTLIPPASHNTQPNYKTQD